MTIRWGYLRRLLAGAIFGLYMAHLLYFLNPQIDITPARLLLVTLVYGLICGLLFGSILWGLRWLRVKLFGRADEYRPHGFGLIVVSAFVSAAAYWVNLAILRIYLPIGAVRILSKATTLIAATAFCLLMLWLIERTSSVRVSRIIFVTGVALIAASSFFLYQRRDRYENDRRIPVVANIGEVAGQRPVILVSIRDLPYDWLLTIMGEGELPWFQKARSESFLTRIEPFPASSPKALLASLATGKLPYRTGVTGRFSYQTLLTRDGERFLILPSGVVFRAWGLIPPVTRISARLPSGDALPVWQLFERLGFPTGVVNWPSTDADGAASQMVTERFFERRQNPQDVWPRSLAGSAELFRVSPQRIDPSLALRFDVIESNDRKRRVLNALTEDLTAEAATKTLFNPQRFTLTTLSLNGFSEALSELRADNILPARSIEQGEAIRAYLTHLDRFLSELEEAHPNVVIAVVSPSARRAPDLPSTPLAFANFFLQRDDPGSDDGFLLLRGPTVASQQNAASAKVVDVVPTVLFAAGLPVGRDMDGRAVTEAFSEEFLRTNSLWLIQTYEADSLQVIKNTQRR